MPDRTRPPLSRSLPRAAAGVSLFLLLGPTGCGTRSREAPQPSRLEESETARKSAALAPPMPAPMVASMPAPAPTMGVSATGLPDAKRYNPDFQTEAYDRIYENEFLGVAENPLSTFSIDVDTASYANVRRFLRLGQRPPKDSVRIEELVNYFDYRYPQPQGDVPFSANVEVARCPWSPEHLLARIGIKGREFAPAQRPAANLVFLLDVSGSMNEPSKLPLLKSAFKLLVEQLDLRDRVAIVVYAGASGLVLPSTTCDRKQEILASLEELEAGGSTNGGQGLALAYRVAEEALLKGGVNRVILATDGDFNVGVTSQGDLIRMVEEKARGGVSLTVLGFGMGNYKDSTLEKLADKGNGNYGYIDTFLEARKLLVEQLTGTLVTIAKDVKIQVEWNPAKIRSYRLIGYENRMLKAEDFNDDTKDAGEIGAGHTVTALYELVPAGAGAPEGKPAVDPLKYQSGRSASAAAAGNELMTVKIRYKAPEGEKSSLIEHPVAASDTAFAKTSEDFRFASAVAGFGMLLRDSRFKGTASPDWVRETAEGAKGPDTSGYRAEFIELVKTARPLL